MPGRYTLRVLRIGFSPTLVPAFDIADAETRALSIVLHDKAFVLPAVSVRETSECHVNPDSGLLVARVWDEARKALLTSQLAAEGAPLFAERIEYDRVLDPGGQLVREQRVRTTRSLTTHGFQSLSAETLAVKGYIASKGNATLFYAPDADVLLSDLFAARHCLRLIAPLPDQSGLVGVGFESVGNRRDAHDIDGTFWIDRATAELRSLEFRYTNLPDIITAAGAGGSVEFLRLADGNWIVSRWNVRLPTVGLGGEGVGLNLPSTLRREVKGVLGAVHTGGGLVTAVTRNDTVRYRRTGPSLVVQLISRDTLVTAAHAMIALDGTDYTATADAAGRIALSPVLEGKYRATIWSPLMDSLGIAPTEGGVDVRADAHVDSLALPTAHDMLLKVCPADSVRHGEGMLRGIARGESGHVLTQTPVTVTWSVPSDKTSDSQGANEQTLGALTDNAGYWRVCGLPHQTDFAVRLVSDSGSDARVARLADAQAFVAVDLVAHLAATAAARGQKVAAPRALVEIAAYAVGGGPLPDVMVEITAPGGVKRTVITGASGRALLPDVTPGLLRMRAKRIGFKPGALSITLGPGRNTVPILLSNVSVPALDTVRIVAGKLSSRRFDGFEQRRRTGIGSYITAEEVERLHPYQLTSLLQVRPGISIRDDGGDQLVMMRGMFGSCSPTVWVDGMVAVYPVKQAGGQVMSSPAEALASKGVTNSGASNAPVAADIAAPEAAGLRDLNSMVMPGDIEGVEIYTSSLQVPAQFVVGGASECGALVIWTKWRD